MKLYWSVTNNCNLRCRYCYYNSGLENKVAAPRDVDSTSIVDDIANNFSEVVFTGGEALTHPLIFILIERLKKAEVNVSVLSNAVLMTEDIVRRLIDLEVNNIAVSLDSLEETINDYLRGKTSIVKRGIETLIGMRTKTLGLEIMMTVTKKNISSIKPLVDYCRNHKMNLWLDPVEIDYKAINLADLKLKDIDKKELHELIEAFHYWAGDSEMLKNYSENVIALVRGETPKTISCPMGSDSFVLDPDGNLYPCFMRKDLLICNLFEQRITDTLNDCSLVAAKDYMKKAKCVRLGCVCMTIANKF